MPKEPHTQVKTHKVRTFFSALAAIIGVYLILSSVFVIWLNQTLTNNNEYVKTVAPLITKPAIQQYIAQEVTTAILKNSPTQNLAGAILSATNQQASLNSNQLDNLLAPIIQNDVVKIIQSTSFISLWRDTNQTAQAAFISQLSNNSGQINLDLSPAIQGLISELNSSQLSALAGHITVTPNTGKLVIKSRNIAQARRYYRLYKDSTYAVVIVAIVALGLAILLSARRARLVRRILLWTGILALVQGAVLIVPSFMTFSGKNVVTENAVKAFIEVLFHGLIIADLVIGIICLVSAVSSMVYVHYKKKG